MVPELIDFTDHYRREAALRELRRIEARTNRNTFLPQDVRTGVTLLLLTLETIHRQIEPRTPPALTHQKEPDR